jgi:iron complex outermembrane recepter protein
MKNWKAILAGAGCIAGMLAGPALAEEAPAAPGPATAAGNDTPAIADIVVTARRRSERLQDVPVAVTVVTPLAMEQKGTFNPVNLADSTPGLTVTASISDRNNLTYTIRGQGFSYGTVFPAVITYFNEVPVANLTQGQFFDMDNVQVLRGPQGVSFGRVTDGGNVMVNAITPKADLGGYLGVKVGDYGLRTVNGAINIPLVKDKVLFRAAFETARRDGFTTNLYNGEKLDNVAYDAFRIGLTLRPVDGFENTTVVSYQHTHDNGTGVVFTALNGTALASNVASLAPLFAGAYGIDGNGNVRAFSAGMTPFTPANYVASMQSQLAAQQARGPRTIDVDDPSFDRRKNLYVVNTTTAELGDSIQLKNIFGFVHEIDDEASNFTGANGAAVLTCHSACGYGGAGIPFNDREQFSEELRLSGKSLAQRLTWAIGGYVDEQKPGGPYENNTINVAILQRVGVNYITTKSRAVYGSAEYAVTDAFKLNGGVRYTHDTVDSFQATYLSPIPGGEAALVNFLETYEATPAAFANVLGASTFAPIPHGVCTSYGYGSLEGIPLNNVLGATDCQENKGSFNAVTWSGGASYKLGGGQLLYAKVSKGYRPGGVNGSAPAGVNPSYDPESDISVEAGIKADFRFQGIFLRTNLAAYADHYRNIQKNVVYPGPVPVSLIQNVDNARIRGVEAEVMLIPVKGLTLGGTFAYTDAKFDVNPADATASACNPAATSVSGFCSLNRFNAVPEGQYTLHADYVLPLSAAIGKVAFGGQLYHQSSVALTDTSMLNPLAIEAPYTTLDLNATWTNVMGNPFDVGFFMTNVTNRLYRIGSNDLTQASSVGTRGDIYAAPRMWGLSFKYRFGADAR